jgi:glycosyltransferase involved in cell wall biosynthesis
VVNPSALRILVVSSHFPPNFVSGGTIQPQRIAHELSARGHQVSVFAGWHGPRPAFDEWDDVDDTGLGVHWIVPSASAWADPRSWDNPTITERFRRHVDALRPDIVHVHSLQSLGAGLLTAAKASGATVTVTMHDFWWLCGRQFLVDPDLRPCSLVVDAGACACEVDESWRRRRSDMIRPHLASADLVLTPSQSAARILRANGIADGRLEVDPNGLPDDDAGNSMRVHREGTTTPRDPDRPVRFLYAGGPHPVKGPGILIDAARLLAGTTRRWTLSAFGIEEHLADTHRSVDDLPITVAPMFAPAERDAVLADHDVLVLPSVALETFSLLTREALAAGLPVICTDNPGPTEVIDDGRNGLIVALADAPALARAMHRVVAEPDLLARLRQGTAGGAPMRPLSEQVDELERRFHALRAASPVAPAAVPPAREPTPTATAVRHVVFVVGINGAPLRYRAMFPAEALALRGVTSELVFFRDPLLSSTCARADALVMYRVPATPSVLDAIADARSLGKPVVFDVDDLIIDPELASTLPSLDRLSAEDREGFLAGVHRYRATLEACDAFIGSTTAMVDEVAALTGMPCFRFDNGYGLELARISDLEVRRPRRKGPLRLGFLSGTITHAIDWEHIEPAVIEVLERRPDVELWLVGLVTPTVALKRFDSRVVRIGFKRWDLLPALLRDLDINLAPLATSARFDAAKSAVKWLEAALCATPTVASPTEPFRRVIEHGRTGMLASTPADWTAALLSLVDDADLRGRIGLAARRAALLDLSPWTQGERYLTILEQVASVRPASLPAPRSTPVVVDEPPLEIVFDSYPDHPRRTATRTFTTRMRRFARRLSRVVRRDGIAVTGGRAVKIIAARIRQRRTWKT